MKFEMYSLNVFNN